MHVLMDPIYCSPVFFPIIQSSVDEMPLRSAAIRRCDFKSSKNNKYQCQKIGDKFQPMVNLQYCRLHDSHAQDRCQVLVEWAGRGAQCEHLGAFDESSGKRLCDWHVPQNKRDVRLDIVDAEERNDSVQGSIDHGDEMQDETIPDNPAADEPTQLSSPHPEITECTTTEAPDDGQARAQSHGLPLIEDASTYGAGPCLEMSLQSTKAAYDTTPPRQSTTARFDFLTDLQDHEASNSNRIVAVYAQCCVCLEEHGEYNMREVDRCKHHYRDLCLRKATKHGIMRKFNCSSCRTWMAEQQANIIESGGL